MESGGSLDWGTDTRTFKIHPAYIPQHQTALTSIAILPLWCRYTFPQDLAAFRGYDCDLLAAGARNSAACITMDKTRYLMVWGEGHFGQTGSKSTAAVLSRKPSGVVLRSICEAMCCSSVTLFFAAPVAVQDCRMVPV